MKVIEGTSCFSKCFLNCWMIWSTEGREVTHPRPTSLPSHGLPTLSPRATSFRTPPIFSGYGKKGRQSGRIGILHGSCRQQFSVLSRSRRTICITWTEYLEQMLLLVSHPEQNIDVCRYLNKIFESDTFPSVFFQNRIPDAFNLAHQASRTLCTLKLPCIDAFRESFGVQWLQTPEVLILASKIRFASWNLAGVFCSDIFRQINFRRAREVFA